MVGVFKHLWVACMFRGSQCSTLHAGDAVSMSKSPDKAMSQTARRDLAIMEDLWPFLKVSCTARVVLVHLANFFFFFFSARL